MLGMARLEQLLLCKPCVTNARQRRFGHSFFKFWFAACLRLPKLTKLRLLR